MSILHRLWMSMPLVRAFPVSCVLRPRRSRISLYRCWGRLLRPCMLFMGAPRPSSLPLLVVSPSPPVLLVGTSPTPVCAARERISSTRLCPPPVTLPHLPVSLLGASTPPVYAICGRPSSSVFNAAGRLSLPACAFGGHVSHPRLCRP